MIDSSYFITQHHNFTSFPSWYPHIFLPMSGFKKPQQSIMSGWSSYIFGGLQYYIPFFRDKPTPKPPIKPISSPTPRATTRAPPACRWRRSRRECGHGCLRPVQACPRSTSAMGSMGWEDGRMGWGCHVAMLEWQWNALFFLVYER